MWVREVAGAGMMRFMRSGVRPGPADSPCDYGLFTNPSYCVHKQNVFGTRAGGLLYSSYEIPPQTLDKSPGPKLVEVFKEGLEDMGP